jgi:8-oxo-dGTP pyrophosphatase MutT (NUDIX family)
MKRYTLGIALTEDSFVFIRKTKPEWQAGKLNFVGGKIEENETGEECISREFFEETGVLVPVDDWKYVGRLYRLQKMDSTKDAFEVLIYISIHEDIKNVKTTTEEEILLITPEELDINSEIRSQLLPNIMTMVHFIQCEDFLSGDADLEIVYSP